MSVFNHGLVTIGCFVTMFFAASSVFPAAATFPIGWTSAGSAAPALGKPKRQPVGGCSLSKPPISDSSPLQLGALPLQQPQQSRSLQVVDFAAPRIADRSSPSAGSSA
jgi:hypothetical protein